MTVRYIENLSTDFQISDKYILISHIVWGAIQINSIKTNGKYEKRHSH